MKKLLLLVAAMATLMTANAAPVTLQQAQTIANKFAQHEGMLRSSLGTLTLAHEAKALNGNGTTDFYVFNREGDTGFVIVSGDDAAIPVLGYSDQGTWDSNDMPENLQWWMSQYQRQMQFLRDNPEAARLTAARGAAVSPMLTSTWKQSAPYNQEIPTSRYSLGTYRPIVGCVALAMAQLMRKHAWPVNGVGSHSYTWTPTNEYNQQALSPQTYSADFTTTYQWSSMKDSYSSSADAPAVGTLCYHCGVAVDMQYGVAASGAQIYDAAVALKTYFRYDKGLDLYLRDFYDADAWDEMLIADLEQGLPILYGGSTTTAYGHCFVFDGYDGNGKFHVNWGWGGNYDGYFATSLLDSGRSNGDFSTWQQAVLGIRPDTDGTSTGNERELTGYMIDFSTSVTSAAVGADVSVAMEGVTFLGEGTLSTSWWGVNILTEDESQVVDAQYFVDASGIEIGATYAADDAAAFTVPSGIANGTYHIRAMYSLDEDQTCHYFERPVTRAKYIKMVVSGGTASFSEGGTEDPVTPETVAGDVTGDGIVDVSDVNALINIILGNSQVSDYAGTADLDGSGEVDVADVNSLVNIILNN